MRRVIIIAIIGESASAAEAAAATVTPQDQLSDSNVEIEDSQTDISSISVGSFQDLSLDGAKLGNNADPTLFTCILL